MFPNISDSKVWPSGPATGLTGWTIFRRMSKDMLATLSEWQQQFGDVFHIRVWPEHIVVVCDPKLARELLLDNHSKLIRWERGINIFSQLHGNSVLTTEGEEWSQKRQALQPYFKAKSISDINKIIIDVTQNAFKEWPISAPNWQIESALTSLTMDVIMQTMFSHGIGEDNRKIEKAIKIASEAINAEFFMFASLPNWLCGKKRKAIQQLHQLIDHHIETRLQVAVGDWPEDYLSYLLRLQQTDSEIWSKNAIRDECMTMFIAGHETTAATLAWWAWCMAANPEYQKKARDEVSRVLQGAKPIHDQLSELHYLTQTIEESMRLFSAVPLLMTRRAIEPLSLGSWNFPKRTLFMIPTQQIQCDEKWHSNPQEYCPDRFNKDHKNVPRGTYAPFGMGRRVCLGQNLATIEIRAITAMILQRWEISIPNGMKPPKPTLRVTLRPDIPLNLKLSSW